jgi:hypothetical protein
MVALSVLLSTTRKFFCESGGAVTCYMQSGVSDLFVVKDAGEGRTPMPASNSPVTESYIDVSWERNWDYAECWYLVTNDGEKLPILVVCCTHCGRIC